jgi:hypothetical protein
MLIDLFMIELPFVVRWSYETLTVDGLTLTIVRTKDLQFRICAFLLCETLRALCA